MLRRMVANVLRWWKLRKLRKEYETLWDKRAYGQSLDWKLEFDDAWKLIQLRNSEGWKVLQDKFVGFLGDAMEYVSGADSHEELLRRKSFREGVTRTLTLLDLMIDNADSEIETKLMERAQEKLKSA